MLGLILVFVLLGGGLLVVLYGSIARNRWGINTDRVSCPRCKRPLPLLRYPQSVRHALWGGGTCQTCGIEVDKWGREVTSSKSEIVRSKP